MALESRTRDTIRAYWADRLDCPQAAFERSGVTFTGSADAETVRILRRGNATVVSSPDRVRGALAECRDELGLRPLTSTGDVVRTAVPDQSVAEVYGPGVLGYVDARAFTPCHSEARLLDEDDEAAFERLRDRTADREWARASPTFRANRTAGLFRNGELVAVGTLGDPPFGDVGVVVDAAHRDEGYAQEVVSRVLAAAFDRGERVVPRYRTPESESASLRVAASLGFERWVSETVVVLD
jgi:GNAT superfamily N-acetyltransferase